MATVVIKMLYCVHEATGIDEPVLTSIIALLPAQIPLGNFGFDLANAFRQVPGVLQAIDIARADPDQLYVTGVTYSGIENAIWPGGGQTNDIQAGGPVSVTRCPDGVRFFSKHFALGPRFVG